MQWSRSISRSKNVNVSPLGIATDACRSVGFVDTETKEYQIAEPSVHFRVKFALIVLLC